MAADVDTGGAIVPIADGESVVWRERREVSILVSREEVTITYARYSGGERVAGPHVHREHTDAFYVLEGELAFAVGREAETVAVAAGGFVAAPPEVAPSFRTAGDRPARWLTIHAQDGGSGAFMRGVRDGIESEWDISPVPADGGLPASAAVVSPSVGDEPLGSGDGLGRLRCALPDLRVVEWNLRGPHADLPLHLLGHRVALLFVIEGELEATFGGMPQAIGPDTLVSVPRDERQTLQCHGRARVLSLHAGRAFAKAHGPSLPTSRETPMMRELLNPEGAIAIFQLEGGLMLTLYPRTELAKDARVPLEPPKPGEFSIGHLVASKDDVDALLAQAKAAGATLTDEAHERPWGIYSGYFRDLDGHLWEIIWNPRLQG
jgi:uncharacterized protein